MRRFYGRKQSHKIFKKPVLKWVPKRVSFVSESSLKSALLQLGAVVCKDTESTTKEVQEGGNGVMLKEDSCSLKEVKIGGSGVVLIEDASSFVRRFQGVQTTVFRIPESMSTRAEGSTLYDTSVQNKDSAFGTDNIEKQLQRLSEEEVEMQGTDEEDLNLSINSFAALEGLDEDGSVSAQSQQCNVSPEVLLLRYTKEFHSDSESIVGKQKRSRRKIEYQGERRFTRSQMGKIILND